ncbi:MAG TPA: ribonuclease HI family protein [Acidobacteriaceae bacterium]
MPSLFPEPSQPRVPAGRVNPQAWVIAHCDGGARGNPGPAGYGATIEDESGAVLAELSEFLGVRTNNVAEYSGLLGVLAWTLEHGYGRLRVVSDSELMVKQMQGRFKVKSPDLQPLWAEARRCVGELEEFEIRHALRHKNKAADRLANEAMDRGMGRSSGGRARETAGGAARELRATPYPSHPKAGAPALRGFTRDGVVHFLGEGRLPDGVFVKIVPE